MIEQEQVSLQQDIELLRKDKRVKSVTYENEIITIHTNNFRCISPEGIKEVYIGELLIQLSFTKRFAPTSTYGGFYNFDGRLDIRNLTEIKNNWETPSTAKSRGELVACWKGYRLAIDKAFCDRDLLTFMELLFRFNSSYDPNIPHGERFWKWSEI